MKKNAAKLLVAAVATSAIVVPVSASAATNLESGVYFAATNEFYTTDQLETLSTQKIGELFSKNSQNQIYIYVKGIGTATLAQANDSDLIKAANANGHKDAPENIIPKGTYTGVGNATVVVGEAETPAPTELKVESVSAINSTTVDVTFPAVTADILGATVEVKDGKGNVYAVKATDISEGDTAASFTFEKAIDSTLFVGVWTVDGKEYSFDTIKQLADIVKAAKATPLNEVTLLNALTAAGIENVDEDSLAAYATAIVDADVETLEDVQVAIDEANEELAEESAADAKVKAVAAATNQVQLLKALQDNFVRVNADWNGGYAAATVNTAASGPAVNVSLLDLDADNISNVTAKAIQAAIDGVNASNVSDAWDTAWNSAKSEDLAKVKALGTAYIADDTDAEKAYKAYLADEVARLEAVIKVNSATTNNSFKNALEALDKLENELVEKYKTTTYASKFQNELDLKTVNADLYAKYIAELAAITAGDDKNQAKDIQDAIVKANAKAADQQIIAVLNADATKISAALTTLDIKQVATTTEHATQYNTDIDAANFSAIFTATGSPVTAITYAGGKTSTDAIAALKGLVDAANIKVIKAEKSNATKLVAALNVLELKNVKPENAAAYLINNNIASTGAGAAATQFQDAATVTNFQAVVDLVNAQVLAEAALAELNAATTAAEVSAALIDLGSTDFINVHADDKSTVATAVLAARDALATKKFTSGANTTAGTYQKAVKDAVDARGTALGKANDLNSDSTISDAQEVLAAVAPTAYEALSNQAKVDAAQKLIDSLVFAEDANNGVYPLKSQFKTLKAVLTAAGL